MTSGIVATSIAPVALAAIPATTTKSGHGTRDHSQPPTAITATDATERATSAVTTSERW